MLENITKLDAWYEMIKSVKNLSLEEAKKLTKKMLEETDVVQKKKMKEELFLGTVYILLEYLKKSYFIYMTSREIDLDNIISESFEMWFSDCSEGVLLEVNHYADLFTYFLQRLSYQMFESNYPLSLLYTIPKKDLIHLCIKYIMYRKDFDSFSFLEFQELFSEAKSWKVYSLFEDVYKEILNMKILEKEKKITARKLKQIIPSLIYYYINETFNQKDCTSFICTQEGPDHCTEVENEMLREQVKNIYNEAREINQRKKYVLEAYVGLNDDNPKTLPEIAREYHVSSERIRVLKYEAGRYFRNPKHPESNVLRYIYENSDLTKEVNKL